MKRFLKDVWPVIAVTVLGLVLGLALMYFANADIKDEERFSSERYNLSKGSIEIITDKKTGARYLFRKRGFAAGMTVLREEVE